MACGGCRVASPRIDNMYPVRARAASPPAPVLLSKQTQSPAAAEPLPDLFICAGQSRPTRGAPPAMRASAAPARSTSPLLRAADTSYTSVPSPDASDASALSTRSPSAFGSGFSSADSSPLSRQLGIHEISPETLRTHSNVSTSDRSLSPDIQRMLNESKEQLRKALRASMLTEARILLSVSPGTSDTVRENARDCPLFDISPSLSPSPVLNFSRDEQLTPPGARPRRGKAGAGAAEVVANVRVETEALSKAVEAAAAAELATQKHAVDVAVDIQSLSCDLQATRTDRPVQHPKPQVVMQAEFAAATAAAHRAAATTAAVRIQSLTRGKQDRRRVQVMRVHKAAAFAAGEDEEGAGAKDEADHSRAVMIQSPQRIEEETDNLLLELQELVTLYKAQHKAGRERTVSAPVAVVEISSTPSLEPFTVVNELSARWSQVEPCARLNTSSPTCSEFPGRATHGPDILGEHLVVSGEAQLPRDADGSFKEPVGHGRFQAQADLHAIQTDALPLAQCSERVMQHIEEALPVKQGAAMDCASWMGQPHKEVEFLSEVTQIKESSWLSDLAQAVAVSIVTPFVVSNTTVPEVQGSSSLEVAIQHSDNAGRNQDFSSREDLSAQAEYFKAYTLFWEKLYSCIYTGLPTTAQGRTPEMMQFEEAMDLCEQLQLWEELQNTVTSARFLQGMLVWRDLPASISQTRDMFRIAIARFEQARIPAPALIATGGGVEKLQDEIMADKGYSAARSSSIADLVSQLRRSVCEENEPHRDGCIDLAEDDEGQGFVMSHIRDKRRGEIQDFFRRKGRSRANERIASFQQTASLLRLSSRSLSNLVRMCV